MGSPKIKGINLGLIRTLLAATLIGLTIPNTVLSQNAPEPLRLRFPRGKNTTTAKGFVGGEATDYYVVHVRAGRKLIIHAISRRKRTQVSVAEAGSDSYVKGKQSDNDLTRWVGTVPRTTDYVIQVNVYPYAERYTLKVTLRYRQRGPTMKTLDLRQSSKKNLNAVVTLSGPRVLSQPFSFLPLMIYKAGTA